MPWDQTCTMQFYFGAGLQRLISVKYKGLLKTQTLSLGGYEIRETTRGSLGTLVEKEERSSFGNGAKVKRWTAVNPVITIMAYEYGVSDRLGSDSVTYTGEGQDQSQRGHLKAGETQKSERQSYDAWCARRNADTWAPAKGPLGESNPAEEREGSNLARGYTGHEMLDDVGLVHMNGRLYDPSLGRMCGADPYVQTPENLQNYNRYSYVLNNPLSQIDPSGHIIIGLILALGAAIIGAIGAVISAVVAFVAYLAVLAAQFVVMVVGAAAKAFGAMGGALMAAAKAGIAKVAAGVTLKKIGLGALISATYNGVQTAINGGSFSDILKAAAIGAVTGAVGAVTGGFLHGFGEAIGGALGKAGMNKLAAKVAGKIIHAGAHGLAGGGMTAAQGGSFQDGFIGSAIGAGVSAVTGSIPGLDALEGDGSMKIVARTAVASISGGVASALAGGKFADGAFSAAFFHLFNHEMPKSFKSQPSWHKLAAIYSNMAYDDIESFSQIGFAKIGIEYAPTDGFAASIYEYRKGKYMLAFRGTETNLDALPADALADLVQGLSLKTSQYEQGIKLAKQVVAKVGAGNVIMTGHSLGGGIASAAAIATGSMGITFNAAGLSARYGGGTTGGQVYAHIMRGDPLNLLQNKLPGAPNVYGKRIYHSHSLFNHGGHSIDNFLNFND